MPAAREPDLGRADYPVRAPPYFVVIDRSLRDEGTSHHYAPPSEFADADANLVRMAAAALAGQGRAPLSARAGRRTRLSAKPPTPLRRRETRAFLPSKWRRRRFMPSLAPQAFASSVSPRSEEHTSELQS